MRWRKTFSAPASKPNQQSQSALDGRYGLVRRWNYETPPHEHGFVIEIIADPEGSDTPYLLVADGPRYAFRGVHYEHYDTLQEAYEGAQRMKDRLTERFDL